VFYHLFRSYLLKATISRCLAQCYSSVAQAQFTISDTVLMSDVSAVSVALHNCLFWL